MEPLKASMIRTTKDFSAPNGSGATSTFDPSRRTSSSFTIRTTGIVASREKPPCRSSKKRIPGRSFPLPDTNYPRSALKSQMEPFPSFVSSAATESWISSGNILPFPSPSFILMSGLKSSRAYTRFSSTAVMNWLRPFLTNYRPGWPQTLKTAIKKKARMRFFFINGIGDPGSYPQPLRSPAPERRRSGAMDNFRSASNLLTMFCYTNYLKKC